MKKIFVGGAFLLCVIGIHASEKGHTSIQPSKTHKRTASLPGNWSPVPWEGSNFISNGTLAGKETREDSLQREGRALQCARHKKNDDISEEPDSCDGSFCALVVFAAMRVYEIAPCVFGCL